MSKIRTVIWGSTGLVGQHFVRLLENHPDFEIAALAASERSAGRPYREAAVWAVGGAVPASLADRHVVPLAEAAPGDVGADVVFSAVPAAAAGPAEAEARHGGFAVFSNASAHRRDADVPILVPEVNPGHLDLVRPDIRGGRGFLVAGSNCSTAGLALSLAPFRPFGLRRVSVVTYQSVSGAGHKGLALLDARQPTVIPFIAGEEEKIAAETRKIFGAFNGRVIVPAGFEVEARCARVPVREGHLLSVVLEVDRPASRAEAAEAVRTFRGRPQDWALPTAPASPLVLREEADRPQPPLDVWAGEPERARGMAVSIGRLETEGTRIRYFALVHNLVRGAAGLCVLNAELALRQGLLQRPGLPGGGKDGRP